MNAHYERRMRKQVSRHRRICGTALVAWCFSASHHRITSVAAEAEGARATVHDFNDSALSRENL